MLNGMDKYMSAGLLDPAEMWARAYAQYIAIKSGNLELLAQLERIRTEHPGRQWNDVDFAPIAAGIDKIMKQRGWLK